MKINAYELALIMEVTAPTIYSWVRLGMPHETHSKGLRTSMLFDLDNCEQWLKEERKEEKQNGKN